jgi:hypothetical protein
MPCSNGAMGGFVDSMHEFSVQLDTLYTNISNSFEGK